MPGLSGLARELKRRKVYRVAIVYAAVAFIIWGAAEQLVPGLALPDWVFRLIILLTILGFPVALVLAWAHDTTPAGVRRADSLRRDDDVVPRAAAPGPAVAEAPDDMRSIAVLPFANMSDDPEAEYFSDGMTEEIINALAQLRDLRVAARTSCFAFKGKTPDLGDVGAKLKVATVLEGSVRRAGNRLRVTAQLVKVADGYHLCPSATTVSWRTSSPSRTKSPARSPTSYGLSCWRRKRKGWSNRKQRTWRRTRCT